MVTTMGMSPKLTHIVEETCKSMAYLVLEQKIELSKQKYRVHRKRVLNKKNTHLLITFGKKSCLNLISYECECNKYLTSFDLGDFRRITESLGTV